MHSAGRIVHGLTLAFGLVAGSVTLRAQTAAPNPQPAAGVVDHSLYDHLLRQHVVKGFVDYDAIAASAEFSRYLTSLDAVKPETLSEDERLAFWINVYNAYTIQLIIAHRETESIRNVNRTLGVLRLKGPWIEPLVHAAGRTLTLDDIHHTILRKDFGEPRTHFALSCAAIGCPPLRSEAYTGALLVDQLNDQAHIFLRQSPTKNRMEKRALFLSPVITAYRNDFGESRQALGRALAEYFDGDDRKLLEEGRFFVRDTEFNWTLNSMAKGRALGLL